MTRQVVRPIGIGYFIGSALIRERRGHAYEEERRTAAAFASCLYGRGADVCVARKSVEGFGEARRRRAVTMRGLATGEP